MYVPKDHKLRIEIIKLHHDTPTAGHPGQWKTLELVTRNYWWPGITNHVMEWIFTILLLLFFLLLLFILSLDLI